MSKILETKRLILRPWEEDDAEDLFKYASHEDVGPIAGWPVHKSVQDSLDVIRNVFNKPYSYAVVLKETNRPVGSIGLMIGQDSNIKLPDDEGEIGFWIGVPYWGQGLIPEATKELIKFAFEKLKLKKLWCGYFNGNNKSLRVQEKCGFKYVATRENFPCAIQGLLREAHLTCLTKEQYLNI